MKAVFCFALVVLAVGAINAASIASPCAGHPKYPNLVLGTNRVPGICALVECMETGEIQLERCPQISVAAGSVIIPEDPSKPFPDCCEDAKRPEDVNKN